MLHESLPHIEMHIHVWSEAAMIGLSFPADHHLPSWATTGSWINTYECLPEELHSDVRCPVQVALKEQIDLDPDEPEVKPAGSPPQPPP